MRNCKTPKLAEGQFIDYAAIHAAKRCVSLYHLGPYTPPKRDHGPLCGEAMTIAESARTSVDNLQERKNSL
jgi:hypothetical protein